MGIEFKEVHGVRVEDLLNVIDVDEAKLRREREEWKARHGVTEEEIDAIGKVLGHLSILEK